MHAGNPPECLTPTLKDNALSEMLVKVADKDKHYIGCEVLNQSPDVSEHTIVEKATSPTGTGKKAPMTLSLADSRMFVINNEKVIEDGASLERNSTGGALAQMDDNTSLVSTCSIRGYTKTRNGADRNGAERTGPDRTGPTH